MTMRGMKEKEMKKVAQWISKVSLIIKDYKYSDNKEERKITLNNFREFISNSDELKKIREEVKELCLKFPIYK